MFVHVVFLLWLVPCRNRHDSGIVYLPVIKVSMHDDHAEIKRAMSSGWSYIVYWLSIKQANFSVHQLLIITFLYKATFYI